MSWILVRSSEWQVGVPGVANGPWIHESVLSLAAVAVAFWLPGVLGGGCYVDCLLSVSVYLYNVVFLQIYTTAYCVSLSEAGCVVGDCLG